MNHAAGTVAGAVERQTKPVEAQAREAREWFGRIAASHVNADAFVQLSLAQLGKVKHLKEAADANPRAFLSAMAECARFGLMPGDTGFYIPFADTKNPENHGWSIVFVKHWTGEVELMYRSGEAEAVVIEAVRAGDQFAWDPSTMRVPEHHIAANDSGQPGLADPQDRGKLTGVYCYVRLLSGGTTFPTVMTPREVKKHYDKSRAGASFWGTWPNEGDWTEDMWKKTAAKKHRGSTPTSPEYRVSVTRAAAMASDPPAGLDVAQPVGEEIDAPDPDAVPALLSGGGTVQAGAITARVEGRRDARPATKGDCLNRLGVIFKAANLHGPQWAGVRKTLAAAAAAPEGTEAQEITGLSDLTATEARLAVERIEALLGMAGSTPAGLALLWWAEDIGAWDRDLVPPPPWFIEPGSDQDRGADANAS